MPDIEVETATRIVYRAAWYPRIVTQANGKYSVCDVPIFTRHEREGHKYDDAWFSKAVETQRTDRAGGFLPRLIKGHTPDSPNVRGENPSWGFLDNYRYDAASGWLYADYVDLTADVKDEIVAGRWPGRSVEVVPGKYAIRAVAMLGESVPWFKLPDLKFSEQYAGESVVCYSITAPAKQPEPELTNMSDIIDPTKYAELNTKLQAAESKIAAIEASKTQGDTKYSELLGRVDTLVADNAALKDSAERDRWTAKYAEKRIPEGRLDVKANVEMLMDLPTDKREKYFDLSIKGLTAPSRKPAEEVANAAGTVAPEPGTQRYMDAFSVFMDKPENKTKYSGKYADAARDFRKSLAS